MPLEEEIEDLIPMPEENDFPTNTPVSQSRQPSPRAKPTIDPQATQAKTAIDPQATQANSGSKQTPAQQQMPANRSRDRGKGGKKVQITGNQPVTEQQVTGPAPQSKEQISSPAPPPRNKRARPQAPTQARPQTRAWIGQGSEL